MPSVKVDDEYIEMLKEVSIDDRIPKDIPEILGQSFYLQIGVYKEYNNARKVRDILNLKGFNARIKHISLNNDRLYSVLEGRYPSVELAQDASNQVKRALSYDSIIKKHE